MLTKRIIACLDVRDGRVVKGVQFVDIIDAGDPAELAARHAVKAADEIVLLDITATHEGRKDAARHRAACRSRNYSYLFASAEASRTAHGRRAGLRRRRGQSQHQLRRAR